MKNRLSSLALVAVFMLLGLGTVFADIYWSESFEYSDSPLNHAWAWDLGEPPPWSVGPPYTTEDQAFQGARSLRYEGYTGAIKHRFPGGIAATRVSAMFYDDGDWGDQDEANIWTRWDGDAQFLGIGKYMGSGSHYYVFDNPGEWSTPVPVSVGWHQFEWVQDSGSVELYIDGVYCRTYAGSTLSEVGLWTGEVGMYVDDIRVYTMPPVPKTKVLFNACTPGRPYGPALFVADGDLANPVRIATPWPTPDDSVTPYGCAAGSFSPDGTRIALSEHGRLAVLDLTALIEHPGQQARPMFDWSMEELWAGRPSWSPDGQRLAYNLSADGLYVINSDGSDRRMLVPWPEPGTMGQVAWSPDGARINFNMGADNPSFSHLWLVEDIDSPTGPAVVQLTIEPAYTDLKGCWSPDSRQIAFTRAPAGWQWNEPSSDVWVKDLDTGAETQLTDTPDVSEQTMGWCPFDGCIYFTESMPGDPVASLCRIRPDGSGSEEVATLEEGFWPHYPFQWLPTGVWIDGIYALPGERVTAKMGIADAESLAGVQARVRYVGCCDTLSMYSAQLGQSILDWVGPEPIIGPTTASILAYAADPETQKLTGTGHLLNLSLDNGPAAQPGDTQLLSFDELLLSDDWGEPVARNAFAGGVRTIPFAGLHVSEIAEPVCADPEQPLGVPVTITALDREGYVMAGCNATVSLGALPGWDWPSYRLELQQTTPTSVTLANGVWSGLVSFHQPRSGLRLLAYWEDIGGYSNEFDTIARGDPSGDGAVSIFDVVKIANMAIGRGTWADWQLWAADVNADGEINVFDVVICANKAMGLMSQRLAVGRAASAPAGPIVVGTTTTSTSTQTTVAVGLSECAGLAGAQVELKYDARKLSYAGMARGALLNGKSSWAALDNDLGGTVKAIAYTASGEVLPGGKGAILTFSFNRAGKGAAKVELTSVKLADVDGGEIACQVGRTKGGK